MHVYIAYLIALLVNLALIFFIYKALLEKIEAQDLKLSNTVKTRDFAHLERLILTEFNDNRTFVFQKINQLITEIRLLKKEIAQMPEETSKNVEHKLKHLQGKFNLIQAEILEAEKAIKKHNIFLKNNKPHS